MKASLLRTAAMLAVAAILAGPSAVIGSGSALAACDPGDRLNGSTAADAKRMIERAGFTQVRILRKGCDNYWHAMASKEGYSGRVVLAPTGEVMPEND
jgi:hypothetical protein